MCRILCTDRKHLKKDHFDERKCTDKLYQQSFDGKIKFVKRQ